MTESLIRCELERLAQASGGELSPEQVVEAARPLDAPLHSSFDWDNSSAAEKYRLHQARNLIRAVVTYLSVDDKVVMCRAFVSLTPDRGKEGYRLTTAVLSDEERRCQLLQDARAEMKVFRDKYRMLSELGAVFAAMAVADKAA